MSINIRYIYPGWKGNRWKREVLTKEFYQNYLSRKGVYNGDTFFFFLKKNRQKRSIIQFRAQYHINRRGRSKRYRTENALDKRVISRSRKLLSRRSPLSRTPNRVSSRCKISRALSRAFTVIGRIRGYRLFFHPLARPISDVSSRERVRGG